MNRNSNWKKGCSGGKEKGKIELVGKNIMFPHKEKNLKDFMDIKEFHQV